MTSDKARQIEDVAEARIRTGGYRAFSFREIASEIGIKSSSVHYHFPTKVALAARVASRYTDRFMERLGDPWQGETVDLLGRLVGAFRDALREDGKMCLCGALGVESADLPDEVAAETRRFFGKTINWLETVYGRAANGTSRDENRAKAIRLLALLEGALLIALALRDDSLYDLATAKIPR
ncbi:MAG: TetR/AcrR family transcriptional regulator [Pseudomonadota bacterium]